MPTILHSEDTVAIRRKRLLYQSCHRGSKEADILLSDFAYTYVPQMAESELALYEQLLQEPDQDLFDWIVGRTVTIPPHYQPLIDKIRSFNHLLVS